MLGGPNDTGFQEIFHSYSIELSFKIDICRCFPKRYLLENLIGLPWNLLINIIKYIIVHDILTFDYSSLKLKIEYLIFSGIS